MQYINILGYITLTFFVFLICAVLTYAIVGLIKDMVSD